MVERYRMTAQQAEMTGDEAGGWVTFRNYARDVGERIDRIARLLQENHGQRDHIASMETTNAELVERIEQAIARNTDMRAEMARRPSALADAQELVAAIRRDKATLERDNSELGTRIEEMTKTQAQLFEQLRVKQLCIEAQRREMDARPSLHRLCGKCNHQNCAACSGTHYAPRSEPQAREERLCTDCTLYTLRLAQEPCHTCFDDGSRPDFVRSEIAKTRLCSDCKRKSKNSSEDPCNHCLPDQSRPHWEPIRGPGKPVPETSRPVEPLRFPNHPDLEKTRVAYWKSRPSQWDPAMAHIVGLENTFATQDKPTPDPTPLERAEAFMDAPPVFGRHTDAHKTLEAARTLHAEVARQRTAEQPKCGFCIHADLTTARAPCDKCYRIALRPNFEPKP